MRIAYGVHGYGRGHAMRARAVLPYLLQRHEVVVFAGGDAHACLSRDYRTVRVPCLQYAYGRQHRLSVAGTVRKAGPVVLDLLVHGRAFRAVEGAVRDFEPDVIVSDSEAFTHRVARTCGIPRISFDHFGLLVYCRPTMSRRDRFACWGNALSYRLLFGEPDRIIVSSFFDAPARRAGVAVVGPVIREEVLAVAPRDGDYLLAYFSRGEDEFTPATEAALKGLDIPVRVYGLSRLGVRGGLAFKPVANLPFIEDLAGCRAVMTSTGNQLCGEAIHLGKPILGLPIDCLEQRLNAREIERMGVGLCVRPAQLTAEVIRRFLSQTDGYKGRLAAPRDGRREAVEWIERFGQELIGSDQGLSHTRGHA